MYTCKLYTHNFMCSQNSPTFESFIRFGGVVFIWVKFQSKLLVGFLDFCLVSSFWYHQHGIVVSATLHNPTVKDTQCNRIYYMRLTFIEITLFWYAFSQEKNTLTSILSRNRVEEFKNKRKKNWNSQWSWRRAMLGTVCLMVTLGSLGKLQVHTCTCTCMYL